MRLRSANLRSQGPAKAADAPARPSLGSAAAPPPTTEPSCNGSSSEAELAAPTPEAPSSRRAKGAKRRLPPVDIGIQELLLGRGMVVAGGKEGLVEAVDRAPLGRVGFTPQTLQAACDFLAKADHSKSAQGIPQGTAGR